jgi:Holliday junction resolvase RusA-like endonuclease
MSTTPRHTLRVLDIRIDVAPAGKGRPRYDSRAGRVHTPARTRAHELALARALRLEWRARAPISHPCRVVICAVFARPARKPRAISSRDWSQSSRLWRPSTPDVDNICKAVLDSLTLAQVLADDRYVCELVASTVYGAPLERPHVHLEVYSLDQSRPPTPKGLHT